ncbi:MAG: DoxX family protein [Flavobacterium sp.]|uniref:DoxX family protein n=1 Tax=Flavobacterium sp. TaxID=239 RepID=UPI0012259185|nr:DoxX family protein [Flavobacterium sp.]RZJ64558.1 MAG: DoxX family protein [Flavobacterium sp.]
MRILTIIIRTLVGLLLLFASISYFFDLVPQPDPSTLPDGIQKWGAGAAATVYLMPLVKGVELFCGLLFVSSFYTALAAIIILPISINAFLIHAFLDQKNIGMAAFLLVANLYLIYTNRDKYAPMFVK